MTGTPRIHAYASTYANMTAAEKGLCIYDLIFFSKDSCILNLQFIWSKGLAKVCESHKVNLNIVVGIRASV